MVRVIYILSLPRIILSRFTWVVIARAWIIADGGPKIKNKTASLASNNARERQKNRESRERKFTLTPILKYE